jgi:hypothetical protein
MTREQAIKFILRVLNSRMAILSPDKTKALQLAEEHKVTTIKLIEAYEKIAKQI